LKIRVERSGGLTGIVTSKEISDEDIPVSIRNKLDKILQDERFKSNSSVPKGAADLLNYKITFEGGTNNRVIECNQITMKKDLKDLVRYIETNSNKK
jgi:hypothetical protein